jgi:hypothetical protein
MNERKASTNGPVRGRLGGDNSSIALVAGLAALVAYMTWVGVSGRPLPDWVLWVAAVL